MGIKTDWERRRRVWDYATHHPDATSIEIAAALGLNDRTVRSDIAAAQRTVNDRARSAVQAAMISRTSQMIDVHLALALAGRTRSAEIVLACHREIRDIYGLDAPQKLDVAFDRAQAQVIAEQVGIPVEELLDRANRIMEMHA